MHLVFNKSKLLQSINIVLKAVPSKTTMPILECILIDASDVIKFTSNDTELAIETIVEGEIISGGIVAIDAKIFSEIIRKFPDSEITITTDENFKTTITCEKATFSIAGKSGEDFSYLPSFEKKQFIYLSQFSLKELIRQTIFSIADNDTNKLMTGELFEVKENMLTVTALDGHRIAIRKTELKDSFEHIKVIVPGKTLNEISKILTGGIDSDVRVFFETNLIAFEFENTIVVSRLIEGEYFKVEQMISSNFDTIVNINKKEFLDCIDRSTLLVKEGDKKPIIINITENELELKISSFLGSMNEQLEINKNGKDLMIGFNPKFLMDALKVIDEEKVDIYFVNPKAPCVMKNSEETYIYLILPVNFNAAY
ncbi:MAG: DNA polymerase III subunit beta [Lachnospiraceae bacterium]|mgnify:CR=1 FL=1|nr:DNA polymerase III subunit beta [Lachnospiraceae bacterium]MCI8825054.1 DNA polymerase III subunit beta [Lachnospiraceae bacterium]MCI9369719.1 DNA polymerase III subunit beta [Lachnospiraceae bacterium]